SARRRHDDRARPRDARRRRPARRANGTLHHAGFRVPARRPSADELPPPSLDAARTRDGLRGRGGDASSLCARNRGALPLLLLRRCDARPVTLWIVRSTSVTLAWERRQERAG